MTDNQILDSILDIIKERQEYYKSLRKLTASHAMKVLHYDIVQKFKCTWQTSEDGRA